MEFKAKKQLYGLPEKKGLYDPQFEKDSCGVGLIANIKGVPSREIMDDASSIISLDGTPLILAISPTPHESFSN